MAYTEFRVTQDANSAADNGGYCGIPGIDGAPTYTITANATVNAGALTTIVDNSGSNWGTAAVGDWLCWDTGGVKEFRRIQAKSGTDVTVDRNCTAGASKTVKVGGYWDTLSSACDLLDQYGAANWPAGVDAPRINVKAEASAYAENATTCDLSSDWSAAIRLTIQTYASSPDDLNPFSNVTRADVDFTSGKINIPADHVDVIGLNAESTTATRVFDVAGSYCNLIGCRGYTTSTSASLDIFNLTGAYNHAIMCAAELENAAASTGNVLFYIGNYCGALGCLARGASSGTWSGACYFVNYHVTVDSCSAKDGYYGVQMNGGNIVIKKSNIFACDIGAGGTTADLMCSSVALNNIFAYCGYGVRAGGGAACQLRRWDFNTYKSNTTANWHSSIDMLGGNDQVVAGSELVVRDYANADYRPPHDALGNATGFPLRLPGSGDGYDGQVDMGALGRVLRAPVRRVQRV